MADNTVFRVQFLSDDKLYEVYVREVSEASMMGFIEIGDFVFGESNSLVLDPSEERLKTEFKGVGRSYLPMHSVVRIDEVNREGVAKIIESKGKKTTVTPFPGVPMVPDDYR